MGIETAALIIGGVAAAAGTGVAAAGAVAQNKRVNATQDAAKRAAGVQVQQLRDKASLEKRQRAQDIQRLRGRIAVAGAESGLAGGTYDTLSTEAGSDLAFNTGIIDQNLSSEINRVFSGLDATNTDLNNRRPSVFGQTVGGTLSGLSTGLSIGGAIRDINRIPPEQP